MPVPLAITETDGYSPASTPVLSIAQKTPGTLSAYLKETDGSAYIISPSAGIRLIAVETYSASDVALTAVFSPVTASPGSVTGYVTTAETSGAGLFLGEFTVYSDTTYVSPVRRFSCYIEILPGLTETQHNAPLSVAELRLAMKDRCAEDNFLLDRTEFTDEEMAYAIRRPIDWWNETAPQYIATYSYSTFPFRYHWTDAAIGELYKIAGRQLSRNRIKITGGGIDTDDKGRADLYIQLGDKMVKEFQAWAIAHQKRLNLQAFTGYVRQGWF